MRTSVAEREVADDADAGLCASRKFLRDWQRGRVDADGSAAEVDAFLDVAADVLVRELRLEDGLVDVAGKLSLAHVAGFFLGMSHGDMLLLQSDGRL